MSGAKRAADAASASAKHARLLLANRPNLQLPDAYTERVERLRAAHPERTFLSINELSVPPTVAELASFVDMEPDELPIKFRRAPEDRVFVNRDLKMDNIKYCGFDMDYTLAIYNSPEYEQLTHRFLIDRLVAIGYPETIRKLQFDPKFAVRGLFVDRKLGNILKVDAYGVIMTGLFGFRELSRAEILEQYPTEHINHSEIKGGRFSLLDTLFALPQAGLLCGLVDMGFLDKMSFQDLFHDVRTVVDWVHQQGELKDYTVKSIARYIQKDPRIPRLLERLRNGGVKTFILTNSDFGYTREVMSYLLNDYDAKKSWLDYFDVVITDAKKPAFFATGSPLREVDQRTGMNMLDQVKELKPGSVYRGGSLELFDKLVGCKPSEVLFVGDHIFGDIIVSKQSVGWRTYLVIPELLAELKGWKNARDRFTHLLNLEFMRAEVNRNMDIDSTRPPDMQDLRNARQEATENIDRCYGNMFGSTFRSGTRKSFFAMQVERYADVYAPNVFNLINYPLFYHFTSRARVMPHEYLGTESANYDNE